LSGGLGEDGFQLAAHQGEFETDEFVGEVTHDSLLGVRIKAS
jgi:hypothetical protein